VHNAVIIPFELDTTNVVVGNNHQKCHTIYIICVMRFLIFFNLFFLLQQNVFSQTDTVNLSTITISDYYSPKTLKNTARVIQVIDKKEIASLPAHTVNELLSQIAQVDVRQRGVGEVQSDISIRGGTYNQVLILVNGIMINDPQTGHHNFDLPVSLEDIQRIEILEGVASNLYGPYALNGAINIVTETDSVKNNFFGKLSGGSFNSYNGMISATYHIGQSNQLLSFKKSGSDGYRDNTDYQILHGFYQFNLPIKKNKLMLQAGLNDKKFGANSFYTPAFPNQYEKTKTFFSSAKLSGGKHIHYTPSISWRRHYDYFVLKRDNPEFYKNNHLTDIFQSKIPFYFTSNLGKTAFGTGIRKEIIYSTALGDTINPTILIPNDTAHYQLGTQRENFYFFLDHSYKIKKLLINGGIMVNSFNLESPKIFPSLNLAYIFNSYYQWFGLINNAVRYPTFTELYYPGLQNKGNPNLKPEKALSIETGIKLNNEHIISHFSIFRRHSTDVIDWVKVSDTAIWESSNITTLTTYGASFSFSYSFYNSMSRYFSLKKINTNYQYVTSEKNNIDYISHYALNYLKHQINLSLVSTLFKHFDWAIIFNYNDRNGTYYNENNIKTDYKPYEIFNTKLNYSLKNICFFVESQNILNKNYVNFGSVKMPGRIVLVGVSVNQGFFY